MKTHLSTLIAITALSLLAAGCSSVPKDNVRLTSSRVFAREDEQFLQLRIETEKSEKFRLWGPHFELWGDTAKPEQGKNKVCTATVLLVGSCITYGDHAYTKLIAQGCGATVTRTSEAAKGEQITNIVNLSLPSYPVSHPLNRELLVGAWGGEEMRLMVGPAVYPTKKQR